MNGVSSTKEISIVPLSLQQGEIHQVQFVSDNTLMLLWSDGGKSWLLLISAIRRPIFLHIMHVCLLAIAGLTRLVNIPTSQTTSTSSNIYTIDSLDRQACDQMPLGHITALNKLDLVSDVQRQDLIRHTFPSSGPKSRPVRFEANGRIGRRAVCVLYAEAMGYEVFDLDTEMQDEEEES